LALNKNRNNITRLDYSTSSIIVLISVLQYPCNIFNSITQKIPLVIQFKYCIYFIILPSTYSNLK
jgi:hypothetical protein